MAKTNVMPDAPRLPVVKVQEPFWIRNPRFLASVFAINGMLATMVALYATQKEHTSLQTKTATLEKAVKEKDELIALLLTKTKRLPLKMDVEFEDQWKSEKNKTEVLRQLQDADFALKKQDYVYAESIYREASHVQETMSVPFALGRLQYMRGDLKAAAEEWKRVITLDPEFKYPEMRYYLGVVLHEDGKLDESNKYLKEYLDHNK